MQTRSMAQKAVGGKSEGQEGRVAKPMAKDVKQKVDQNLEQAAVAVQREEPSAREIAAAKAARERLYGKGYTDGDDPTDRVSNSRTGFQQIDLITSSPMSVTVSMGYYAPSPVSYWVSKTCAYKIFGIYLWTQLLRSS